MTRVIATLASLIVLGCSSPTSPSSCPAYQVPATTDLAKPLVSFKSDVLPILQQNCALSACHGSQLGTNNGVYLGAPAGTIDANRVWAAIVNAPSQEAPSQTYVVPSDPSKSFLQHKIDGDVCSINQCATGCGIAMPKDAAQLTIASRDVIRRWIAQGALND
jgi:hypothetical protein